MAVLSDIEIARENSMAPIEEIASKLDLNDQNLQKILLTNKALTINCLCINK